MHKGHRTLIIVLLHELHTLDLLDNFAIESQTGTTKWRRAYSFTLSQMSMCLSVSLSDCHTL